MRKSFKGMFISSALIVAVLVLTVAPALRVARANPLTSLSATLSTLKQNTKANQTILFTLSAGGGGLAASETIILTYDSDIDVTTGLDFEDIDLSFDTTPDGVCETGDTQMTLAAAPVTTTMGVVRTSAQIITFTNGSTTAAAGSEICIQIGTNATEGVTGVEQIKNAVTAASDNLVISGTMGADDTGTIVITSVTDDVVVATATVPASLSFTISDNDIFFGTLDSANEWWADNTADGSATEVAAHTMAAGTNSSNGYTITVNGATLASTGTPADTITAIGASATDVTAGNGSEQFGIRLTASGGSGAASAPYNGAANMYALDTAAFPDAVATSATESVTTTYSVYYAANISAATEAHTDYTSSLTYVATGNF